MFSFRFDIPGIVHRQFVNMAPLTASNSGKTTNISSARPNVCNDSIMKMNKKWELNGRFHDLKKQIRAALIHAPTSGMAKAISSAHIHATLSSSGKTATNVLSLPLN